MTRVDPLAYLAGRWSLGRELLDERTGARGTFDGTATFAPSPSSTPLDREMLDYREQGALVWPSHRGVATRSLSYVRDTPARAAVCFADGRPFHALELREEGFDAEHLCGEDRYVGRFVLLSRDAWTVTWRVTGPLKDQQFTSRYERSDPASTRELSWEASAFRRA